MPEHKVAVIRGDGIGIEVIEEAIRVLEAVAQEHDFTLNFTEYPWGTDYYFEHGEMMPSDGLDLMAEHEAVFLGAVGHPDVQDHITLSGLLLPIRRSFDQYVNERPSVLYPGITSPLSGKKPYDIDMMCIRENTEGEYADVGGFLYPGTSDEIAVQSGVFTRKGCERVITYAFETARKRNKRKHLTSITKSNALGYGMVLWDRTFQSVAKNYPDVTTNSLLIDAACMDFVRRPESFDVVVGSNLFGDILTDIGAIITGSIGLAASANIDPERRFPSMFEPVHGTAPDIAGKGIANPMAAVLSAAMMLRHLGHDDAAATIDKAVLFILEQGEITTPDLGGSSSTSQVSNAIISALGKG
ncbi:MAG: tartrate dehydrogenase [SAR202 cluster bacterium Casp-Chloro-G4]|nr:tartrate dehydrogenase [Chloroflexota bacterium]MDA1226389.1 tartrate dehydrogenase [Chloroflexota bacterium]PKB61229.1 MAG: tartrate dehydrogenase [SAR202 cluster bacterium Casp-Chloro-G4]